MTSQRDDTVTAGYGDAIPLPLLKRGDYIRLQRPYKPTRSRFLTGPLAATTRGLIQQRARDQDDDDIVDAHPDTVINRAYGCEAYQDLFTFTHGIITEIVSRHPWSAVNRSFSVLRDSSETSVTDPPAQSIGVKLVNPATGVTFAGGHQTEPGKLETIDVDPKNLVLIHKHDDNWGVEYEIAVEDIYTQWGV